jgi:hypothetical protein
MTKDNIMKLTDGLFHKVFDEISQEYPGDRRASIMIIDIGAADFADTPEQFDVIVTLNLYGDVLSDIASQVAGSVGLGGSANIGSGVAMFEAVHGSAPTSLDVTSPTPRGCSWRRCRCWCMWGRRRWRSGSGTPGSAPSKMGFTPVTSTVPGAASSGSAPRASPPR